MKTLICLLAVLALTGCASSMTSITKDMIGTPEQGREQLVDACKMGPYAWGRLEGWGILDKITIQVKTWADEFSAYCKRTDLTDREVGKALSTYERIGGTIIYDQVKGLAISLAPMFGGLPGGIPFP